MSISDKLTTIRNAIKAIKQAIIDKGQTPSGDITTYSEAIGNISGGTTINNQDKTITENGSYTADTGYTGLGTVTVNVPSSGGVQYIPREVTSDGVLQYPSTDFTFSLPSNVTSIGEYVLYYAFYGCESLTSVDLSGVTSVGIKGLNATFNSCSSLTSVDLSSLTSVSSYGLYQAFKGCSNLKTLSFPALTSTSFGTFTSQFNNMLNYVTDCTVHFPSNLESVIGSWSSVTSGFGGTSTQILFDLDPTE